MTWMNMNLHKFPQWIKATPKVDLRILQAYVVHEQVERQQSQAYSIAQIKILLSSFPLL